MNDCKDILQQGWISLNIQKWGKVSNTHFRGTYIAGKIIKKSLKELINMQFSTVVNFEGVGEGYNWRGTRGTWKVLVVLFLKLGGGSRGILFHTQWYLTIIH